MQVGQRFSGEFRQFDQWNLEARLSLRATQPDPFRTFAAGTAVGRELRGRVTKVVPIGVFVRVAGGVEGLVRKSAESPPDEVEVGAEITVVVTGIDPERRRLTLARRRPGPREHSRGTG